MKEWLSEYGYLIIVFIVVLIIFIFLLNKAAKAYSKHVSSYKAQEAEIKRLTALKEKYADFTLETLTSANKEEVLEGVTLIYQLYLQKQEKMEDEFLKFNPEAQNIYVLDVFVEDASLITFFSENTDILRSRIVPALQMIGFSEESKAVQKIWQMYDLNCEEASLNEKEIENIDKSVISDEFLTRIKLQAAEYIINNFETFKNYK